MSKKDGKNIIESILSGVMSALSNEFEESDNKPEETGNNGQYFSPKNSNGQTNVEPKNPEQTNLKDRDKVTYSQAAEWIIDENEKKLRSIKYPTPKEVVLAEMRNESARDSFYTVRDIKMEYYKEMGIRDRLLNIEELSDYVPEGLRGYREDNKTCPLHSAVWNTLISTIFRQNELLCKKKEKLIWLISENEEAYKEKISELIGEIREVYLNFKEKRNNETMANVHTTVVSYRARKKEADRSYENFIASNLEDSVRKAIEFCQDLDALLKCESCSVLEGFDDSRKGFVTAEMGEDKVEIHSITFDYYEKLCNFSKDIRQFLDKWTEEYFR